LEKPIQKDNEILAKAGATTETKADEIHLILSKACKIKHSQNISGGVLFSF
jgi:hypothetical protein